ncbi:MAG: hypothetical protein J6I50_01880 [Clostridia bacterium]|nr:hypothetical protein [Clostridia bacterium]
MVIKMEQNDFSRINEMMKQKGVFLHEETGKSYYTGYEYATLYDWDQYFETIVQLYLGWDTTYARLGVEIFLDLQKENGHIQRSSKGAEEQLSEHVKPFLAQICLLIYNRDGTVDFLREQNYHYYNRLKKYLDFWLFREENFHGLAFWDSAPHTGMDTQHERAGYWFDRYCCGVDLNSYLVRECRAFALLARIFGKDEDAVFYETHAKRLADTIVDLMWNKEDGFFYDIDRRNGKQIPLRYIGVFAAMWAGIASPDMAKSMVEKYLLNPNEFNRGFIYPVMSAAMPGYSESYLPNDMGCNWRANTWIPTNYYVFEALRMYGFHKEAAHLAEETNRQVKRIGDREYYATESQTGCGLNPFWGWSLLAYFMPYENETEFDPTEIKLCVNDHIVLNK